MQGGRTHEVDLELADFSQTSSHQELLAEHMDRDASISVAAFPFR